MEERTGSAKRSPDAVLSERRVFHITEGETPFEDSTFDFVFHNQVFEHVPDLDKALQEIRRVLKSLGE